MLTILRRLIQRNRCERGQMLVIAVFFLILVMTVAALVLDAGFFLRARRDSQNTADAAVLAGAQDLPGDPVGAEDAALAWAAQNGWTNGLDGATVTVTTPYNGNPNKIEVVVAGPARGTLFFDTLFNISSRAVAEVVETQSGDPGGGGGGGGGGEPAAPVPGAGPDCVGDGALVDGRVMPNEDYEKFSDLVGGGTVFGEALFACDSTYYYFAMRLNALSSSGVANENVYQCVAPKPGKGGKFGECTDGDNPTYHGDYDTGWLESVDGRHTYKDLILSDRARFQISCGTTPIHDFVQDYLYEDGTSWASDTGGDGSVIVAGPADSASSLEYNLEHPSDTGWGDGTGENPLNQSPPFNPAYPNYDSEYDGWVWEMIYEFKVPRSAYDACGSTLFFGLPEFAGQTGPVGGIHSSPAKVAEGGSIFLSTREILLVE